MLLAQKRARTNNNINAIPDITPKLIINSLFSMYPQFIVNKKYKILHSLKATNKIIKKSRNKFSERYYWTGITVLDNVISIEKRKMDNMNIEFHIETDVTDIVMEDIDIIILLENLFDNAIEAVEKCANKKEIKFSIKNINSMLVLKLWNSSCKKPKVKKERFVTDKHDSKGHGWGLESVKYIVKKYDGIIEFEYTEMFFQTVIMIEGE